MEDFEMDKYINEESIIEDDIYSSFKDSVICPICTNIIINPVMCMNCQNSYCEKCINNWSERDNRCPNHCENPNYKKSIEKNTILSKLKFKCNKCNGEILYDNVKKHAETCKLKVNNSKSTNTKKIKKLIKNDVDKLRAEGKELTYITCKQ